MPVLGVLARELRATVARVGVPTWSRPCFHLHGAPLAADLAATRRSNCTIWDAGHCGRVMAGSGEDDFERFFHAQAPSVAATVFRVVGDAAVAEELTQEAFFQTALRWRRLRRYDRPGAWVRRVAIRDAVRASRREQRYDRRQPVEAAANQRSLNGWSTEDGLSDGRLWSAVLALPGKQRAAVALYYLDDRPTAEVAELVGCSEATVRSHLRAARRRLADLLSEHDEGEVHDARR